MKSLLSVDVAEVEFAKTSVEKSGDLAAEPFSRSGPPRTRVCNTILLASSHSTLGLCELCRRDHFHRSIGCFETSFAVLSNITNFVIFSMFLMDLRRSSISRRVAMLRALPNPAPERAEGAQLNVLRASMTGETGSDTKNIRRFLIFSTCGDRSILSAPGVNPAPRSNDGRSRDAAFGIR